MRLIIALSLLISTILAQGMGDGISKSTMGSSDPRKCAAWFKKYLPATETASSCTDGKCECATQGRYQLDGVYERGSFGLHTINCTYHPYGEYGLADIEGKIHKEWGDFEELHPFMEYNVGLWAPDLKDYITEFTAGKVNMTMLKWKSDDDKDYYSIIVNPCGYVVIEIMGIHVPDASLFKESKYMRFSFKNNNNLPSTKPLDKILTPLKISRATARMEDLKAYYTSEIGVKLVYNHTYEDGSEHAIFMYEIPVKSV